MNSFVFLQNSFGEQTRARKREVIEDGESREGAFGAHLLMRMIVTRQVGVEFVTPGIALLAEVTEERFAGLLGGLCL